MSTDKLLAALKEKKLVFGTDKTLQMLKNNEAELVFLSSNCPQDVQEKVNYLARISNVLVTVLTQTNEELGAFCKKPFSISVASIRKEK